jgi:hypothetical protein
MTGYLKDFSVEILNDGKVSVFFPCGHSLVGAKIIGIDLSHKCEATT